MDLQAFAVWWDDLSDPKVATPARTLADIKADLEQLCSLNNVCTYDMTKQVGAIASKLDKVTSEAEKMRAK